VLVPPKNMWKEVLKHVGMPSLLFLVANLGFAYVVSIFMGEGLTGYVGGRTPTLGLTDPTTTLLLMVLVDIVFVIILWKLIKLLFISVKNHSIRVALATADLGIGALKVVSSKLSSTFKSPLGGTPSMKGGFLGGKMPGAAGMLLNTMNRIKSHDKQVSNSNNNEGYSSISNQLVTDYKNWSEDKAKSGLANKRSSNTNTPKREDDQTLQAFIDDLASKSALDKPSGKSKDKETKVNKKTTDK